MCLQVPNVGNGDVADIRFASTKVCIRLTGDGRLSELLAPNRPVIYAFQRQQSGVDFAYLSTRHRPQAGVPERPVWGG